MQNLQLGELIDSISVTHKFDKDRLVFLNTSDVLEGEILTHEYINVSELKGQAKKTIQRDDILFSEIRPKNKRYAYVEIEDTKDYVVSTKLMVLRNKSKEALTKYIYYFLTSEHFLDYLQMRAESRICSFPQITFDILKPISIRVPTLDKQEKIVSIIDNLNKKISTNNQINATLEQMAKTLYDYWFVQFDFPDDNGKPYKSSGGETVYNETLKRDIPKGWEVKKLVEIEKNIVTGKTPPTSNPEFFGDEIPFITISDIRNNTVIVENEQFLSRKGADYQKGKYLPSGSLCVSCIATVGLIGFITRKSQTNQQINSIIFKHGFNRVFLFFALNNYFSVAKAKTGNTFANMNKADFEEINVVYPPIDVLKSFQDKVSNQFNLIKNQSKQNGELTKLRDWLLPMLMNGQVTVQ